MLSSVYYCSPLRSSGCGDPYGELKPGRQGRPLTQWSSRGGPYTDPSVRWYLNFYETHSNYPGYAIANYNGGPDNGLYSEHELFVDSLRLCRDNFADTFNNDKMEVWDSSDNAYIPFQPEYIAVIITTEDIEGNGYCDREAGAVFCAAAVFHPSADVDDLVSSADIVRGNVWFQEQVADGSLHTVYSFIEDHMARPK